MDDAVLGGIVVFALLMAVLGIGLGIYSLGVMWKLFDKAGVAGWKSIIPYYNLIKMSEIGTGKTTVGIILIVITIIAQVFSSFAGLSEDAAAGTILMSFPLSIASAALQIYMYYKIAKSFGCSDTRCVCAAIFGSLALGKPAFDKTGRYSYMGQGSTYASRVYGYENNYSGQNYGGYIPSGGEYQGYSQNNGYSNQGYGYSQNNGYSNQSYGYSQNGGYSNQGYGQNSGYSNQSYGQNSGYSNQSYGQNSGYSNQSYGQTSGYSNQSYGQNNGYSNQNYAQNNGYNYNYSQNSGMQEISTDNLSFDNQGPAQNGSNSGSSSNYYNQQ